MAFKDSIPERVLESSSVNNFVEVLNELHNYKEGLVTTSLRSWNPAVFMNKKWLIMRLQEYGVSLPYELPIQVMQQFLLNINEIFRLRGSKLGLQLWLSVITLGEITIDDSDYWGALVFLSPNSKTRGYITCDNTNPYYYMVNNSDQLYRDLSLGITIKSAFNNDPTIKAALVEYFNNNLRSQLGFPENVTITITWQSRTGQYFHSLLNPYFV